MTNIRTLRSLYEAEAEKYDEAYGQCFMDRRGQVVQVKTGKVVGVVGQGELDFAASDPEPEGEQPTN